MRTYAIAIAILALSLQGIGGKSGIGGKAGIGGGATAAASTPESVAATIVSGQGLTWYGYSADCITFSPCSTPGNGSTVTAWDDESGNANNLSCVNTGVTATYNTNQVNTFSGVTVASNNTAVGCTLGAPIAATTSITMFVVLNISNQSSFQIINYGNPSSFSYLIGTPTNVQTGFIINAAILGSSNTALTAGTWYQVATNYNGTTENFYLGSASDGSASATNSIAGTITEIGGGQFGAQSMKIASIFFFTGSSVVNGTNTAAMLAAMHAKYGT